MLSTHLKKWNDIESKRGIKQMRNHYFDLKKESKYKGENPQSKSERKQKKKKKKENSRSKIGRKQKKYTEWSSDQTTSEQYRFTTK